MGLRGRWIGEGIGSAYAATGRGGAIVAVGLPHPDAMFSIPALSIVATNRQILGSYMASAQLRRDIPAMHALWRAGRLPVDRLKSAELPLLRINDAFEALVDGSALRQIPRPDWADAPR